MSAVELLVSLLLVLPQALWLAVALWENLRRPAVNAALVASVLRMEPVRQDPAVYEAVKGNRIEDPAVHRWAFRLVVAVEVPIVLALLAAAALLGLAAAGKAEAAAARELALLASAAFTALWGALLIGGERFYYWLPDPRLQTTHFLLLLWGVATLAWLR